jgi:DNA-binding CsgD family transcriptional regulator
MTLFTESDLARAGDIMTRLLDPHAAGSVNQWRSDINRRLIDLLGADSAGFILPVAGGPIIYSDEHDAAALAQYPDLAPPALLSGQPIFARAVELGVSTLDDIWGAEMHRNLSSAYHNEYVAPNRAFDTLGALTALPRLGPHGMAGVQLWHDRPTGRRFGDRERALLRVIHPALQAGIEARLRWEHHHAELLTVLDALPHPTLVCVSDGRAMHRTPSLEAELAADSQSEAIEAAMHATAAALGDIGAGRITGPSPHPGATSVSTVRATYRITGSLYRSPLPKSPVLVIVSLERLTPVRRSDAQLREEYRLTTAELRVIPWLVAGMTSAEIATQLQLSRHTVRRHSESILLKTGCRSRVELTTLLHR